VASVIQFKAGKVDDAMVAQEKTQGMFDDRPNFVHGRGMSAIEQHRQDGAFQFDVIRRFSPGDGFALWAWAARSAFKIGGIRHAENAPDETVPGAAAWHVGGNAMGEFFPGLPHILPSTWDF
jgi:hypothetical protein